MSVVRVFEDIDMRLGITGLTELLGKRNTKAHKPDDMFMFINKKKTHVKVVWSEQYCLQFRKQEKITVEELKAIPSYFKRQFMDYKAERRAAEILGKSFDVKAVS